MKTKIWGVVALAAALIVGLVIGAAIKFKVVKTSDGVRSYTLGSTQTSPTHLVDSGSLTSWGSGYFWDTQSGGGLEVAGATWLHGNVSVSGTLTVAGAQTFGAGTFSSLTVTGATALNGGLTMDTNKFVVTDATGNVSASGTASFATTTVRNGLTVGDGTHGLTLSGASGANLGSGSIAGTGNVQFFGRFDAFAGVFLNETSGYTMIGTSTAPTADLQVLNRVGANGTSTTVKIGKTSGTGCLAMPDRTGVMHYIFPTSTGPSYMYSTTTRPTFCKP